MIIVGVRGDGLYELVGRSQPITREEAIQLAAKLLVSAHDSDCTLVKEEIEDIERFQRA